MQKQLLIAGSVLGALALGHQAVSADTVPTTDTSSVQSVQATAKSLPQVKAVVLSATTDVTSDASSTVDDGTTVDNGGTSSNDGTAVDDGGSSSSSDNGGSGSSSDNNGGGSSSDNGGSGSSSDNNGSGSSSTDDGTTVDNGGSSSSSGNGGSNSSSDNGSSSSSDNGGSNSSSDNSTSSSSDNGGSSSSSDNNGSSSNGGGTDSSTTGGNGSSSDNNTVPLTPTTPDTNNQGEVNHVKPIEVTPDNSGNVVDVPTQVASVPSIARAVEAYNQALTANDKDATKAQVVEAKQKLDDAVAKALPLTHATEKSSMGGNGILALAMSGLVALGGLIYKRKHL
ncbi:serine-rich aggregation substance UasX [Leuconostoc mesenteroides]|uniref:serine-rich aggregation substance UasX n=1 Tax=Leuconostoc mesenteroides TaxID=1245 RepID=UPI001CBE70F0|nr:serine-rich aggregation substance UasX [Leuconostoc mesenteroides]MBZ1519561.1 serine-rich aggregation substance UasX [Leuconostoc mesenteroides]MBZ1521726.1 serine-rich aggregation substance UasX [Leuconostoc mesenteroides]